MNYTLSFATASLIASNSTFLRMCRSFVMGRPADFIASSSANTSSSRLLISGTSFGVARCKSLSFLLRLISLFLASLRAASVGFITRPPFVVFAIDKFELSSYTNSCRECVHDVISFLVLWKRERPTHREHKQFPTVIRCKEHAQLKEQFGRAEQHQSRVRVTNCCQSRWHTDVR
jgi:hypothetical protein